MKKFGIIVLALVILTVGFLGYYLYVNYVKEEKPRSFSNETDHFLYGSIGAEVDGYPYNVWKVLPTLFEDKIPNGYSKFGFLQEEGKELPLGISVQKYGIERVGFNCATCHTSKINNQLLLGAPAQALDIQAYLRFLEGTVMDPRFNPDNIFSEFKKHKININFLDKLIYQWYLIPKIKSTLAERNRKYSWERLLAVHGPGRTDAINPWKYRFGILESEDSLINSVVSLPSIWNQKQRKNVWMHWDGNNKSVYERNISAALAGGATEESVDIKSIKRVAEWLDSLNAPKYPFAIDVEQLKDGESIFKANCGSCHSYDGDQYGQSTPIAEIQTDPERWQSFNDTVLKMFATVGEGYEWQFNNYRKSSGYANQLLDGIWARYPYLHNNSIPSLMDLLTVPEKRPTEFYVGCETMDTTKVGINCSDGFLFDTRIKGNSNSGHIYGTQLTLEDKVALIKYLKSL